ncbi:GspH/FimT family pseudopilin [Shewanella sp.]|uniref:GspH/FimT family pseudopilin n=1 Tax=Shewanella sp. TaxID=50422 RepID=UPI003A9863FB
MKLSSCGFTLVELMVTICVASIILGIGVPSLKSLMAHYQASTTLQQLRQAIWLARNQAISYGARTTLCHLENNNCNQNLWQQGVTVFVDINGNFQKDDGEPVLYESGEFGGEADISFNRQAIRFLPTGLASGMNGTLSYCPQESGVDAQAIIVNQAGRIHLSDNTNC